MAFNRLIDRTIDQKNPRTAHRALACGRITPRSVLTFASIALALFLLVTTMSGVRGLLFGVSIASLIILYSYAKRHTPYCHVVLGLIYCCIPLAGVAAVGAPITIADIFFGIAAGTLITGTDIYYAISDIEFDRAAQLHSLPAVLGEELAAQLARVFHMISAAALFVGSLFSSFIFVIASSIYAILLVSVWRQHLPPQKHLTIINTSTGALLALAEATAYLWNHLL